MGFNNSENPRIIITSYGTTEDKLTLYRVIH